MIDFATRCQYSSQAWSSLDRTEIRAVSMIGCGRILTYRAWMGLVARIEAHAQRLRHEHTVPSVHGHVWRDSVAVRAYRRLRSLQDRARALAQVAHLLDDQGVN